MQAKTPRPRNARRFDSPVGPGSSFGLPKSSSARAGVVAQEVHGFAHLGNGVRHGLAGLRARRSRRTAPCRARAGRQHRAASAPAWRLARDPIPAARPPPASIARLASAASASAASPITPVEIRGRAAGAALALLLAASHDPDARAGRLRAPRRQSAASSRCSPPSGRLTPDEFLRSAPKRLRGAGMRGCGPLPARSTSATGSPTTSSTGSDSSTMRFTKEVLAPFSSRRRTRYGSSSSCEPTGA